MNEVAAAKVTSLQRCIGRARDARKQADDTFKQDWNLQDACILNIIRACETAIDLANMLIRIRRWGIPADTRESFEILGREQVLDTDMVGRLKAMVGFRNLAVHQYREINLNIVESILAAGLDDLLHFAELVRRRIDGE